MSGKKAADVSVLLDVGARTRGLGTSNLLNIMDSSKKNISNCELEINAILRALSALQYTLSDEARKEFPMEGAEIENQIRNIQKSLKPKKYNIAEFENGVNDLNRMLSELDQGASRLRNIIERKLHNCDPEYNQAEELVKGYRKAARIRDELAEKIKSMSSQANMDLLAVQNSRKQMEILLDSIDKLNQKAKDVMALREEAAKIKTFIDQAVRSIDETIAVKFMDPEYRQIQKLSQSLLSMTDQDTVSQFKQTEEKISLFKNTLQQKHAAFEAEKAEATAYLKEVADLTEKDKYYHPLEYAKNKETAETINLQTFLTEYAQSQYISEIKDGIAKAQAELSAENFQAAKSEADAVRATIAKAVSYANIKQESILKNIFMAFDIRNVMRKLNYQTDAAIIDGDITKGFRITCKAGEELIDFEQVLIDDQGKVTMNIDHTEGVSNTCGVTWGALQAELAQHGILIRDVLKNGKSVINPEIQTGDGHRRIVQPQ